MILVLALLTVVCVCAFAQDAVPPIPGLAQWEARMKDNARIVAAQPERIVGSNVSEAGWGGKQFSQNYHWSFDYVRWRSVAPEPNLNALELKMTRSN